MDISSWLIGAILRFSTIFKKGKNFCDFLFASAENLVLAFLNMESSLKKKISPRGANSFL